MTVTTSKTHPLTMDRNFEPLKDHLIAATGLSYYHHRSGELADHIHRRLKALGIADCHSYLRLLQSGPAGQEELDNVIEDLTIGETHFFRHLDLFMALEQEILPDVIERNRKNRRLRIWSAGSSIGAEAYTVSIILKRRLAHLIRGWDITIIGTDINRAFLARAALGQFEDWALRGLSEELKQQCFTRQGKFWTLHSELKDGVSFQYQNLAKHPFPSLPHNLFAFDVIFCRNVMIYFSQPVIEKIVDNLKRCLVDGGWLLVGHAEHNLDLFRDFRTVNFPGATAYQRVAEPNAEAMSGPTGFSPCAEVLESPLLLPRNETEPPKHELAAELASLRLLANRGDIEQAEAECQQLLKTHKLSPFCHLYHALILEQLGRSPLAEQALRRAIYLDRGFALAHYYLGLTLQRLGRLAESVRSLRNARQLITTLDPKGELQGADNLTVAKLDELIRIQLDAMA